MVRSEVSCVAHSNYHVATNFELSQMPFMHPTCSCSDAHEPNIKSSNCTIYDTLHEKELLHFERPKIGAKCVSFMSL